MRPERLTYLIGQLVDNKISPDEKAELRELLNNNDENILAEHGAGSWLNEQIASATQETDEAMERRVGVIVSIDKTKTFVRPVHRVHFLRRWGWAAAILIILGGAYLFTTNTNKEKPVIAEQSKNDDIVPGTNKALLTLSDGTIITLDSAANGAIAQQGNASVIKTASGEIRYDTKGEGQEKLVMNTMTTPKGGQYQLVLPDGSKIWLNAASSVTYPAFFAGNERKIKIAGEIYLEVAKDKSKPFIVDVDGRSEVQVLGTSFNINSYADEEEIKTTLIDGSLKVRNIVLKPGQQAVQPGSISTQKIRVVDANIAQVMAWKNGLFNLEGADIKTLMNQIGRWYNLDIIYEGNIAPSRFVGKLPRSMTLKELLTVLEEFEVNFRLEGRRLTVVP